MVRQPSTAQLLPDPAATGETPHIVQFYEDEAYLCETVASFVGAGLNRGEPAVVIATAPHRSALRSRLAASGIEVERAVAAGHLVLLDAADTLSEILVGGLPDADRFTASVGSL
ncbi:MAG TPA: MEDS domain-containing protein, partial [Polyangia bacterium]